MLNFTIMLTIIALLSFIITVIFSIKTFGLLSKKFLTDIGTVLMLITGFTSCVGILCWLMVFLIAILF